MCICPLCRTINFHVGKICSRTGELICIDCCKECEDYYNDGLGSHGCRYVAKNWHDEKPQKQIQLNRIHAEIERKYEEVTFFYETDRPYIAKRIEAEITRLRYEEQNIIASMADAV